MRAPFNNQFFQDQFNDDFIESIDPIDIERKKEIAGIMLQDLMNRQSGNVVAPDTTGVGFYFLMNFITPEMSCDFALIEQDFLKNCRSKLDEFRQAGWYGDKSFRTNKPNDALQNCVLRLIYNGAKLGDEYCLELIKNLWLFSSKLAFKPASLNFFTKSFTVIFSVISISVSLPPTVRVILEPL